MEDDKNIIQDNNSLRFVADIKQIVERGRQHAYASVNAVMIETYWHIGERIVKEEQHGKNRADYGKQIIFGYTFSRPCALKMKPLCVGIYRRHRRRCEVCALWTETSVDD